MSINPEKNITNDFQILYICSAARSGSTLTDMFMGGHSQAASLGEINLLNKAIKLDATCSCGSKIRECGEWQKVFDAILLSQGINMIEDPYKLRLWDALAYREIDHQHQTNAYHLGVNLRKAWMEVRDYLPNNLREHFPIPPILHKAICNKMDLYEKISRCWNKLIILDSSKNAREAVELHKRWPNRVKVVLLTRDGRGVYLSRRSSGRSQSESVSGWLKYYQRALPLLERHIASDSLIKLRYEELASEPEKTGHLLCDFVGICFEQQMLDLSNKNRHLVNGNDTRFSPGKGIHLDERWRTKLLGTELEFFQRTGGSMNSLLGYH
ncbi:sulfotransferase [Nitrosomonas sp. JL21]|uniref:sulfotransferase n=1 Tax=Nitrosomonas sp. JL21 TaxID=153949 RepID=UPI00195F8F79|nr:sulfotransferase [Nitrosomonas sp. JL21]